MRDDRLDNQINYNNETGQSKLVKVVQYDSNGNIISDTNPLPIKPEIEYGCQV